MAQSEKDILQATMEGKRAMDMIRRGLPEEGIRRLKYCIKLDPSSIIYPLEIAFAYYLE